MVAVFNQLPGQLDVSFVQGDEVNIALSFPSRDLTGYTFSAVVYVVNQTVPLGGGTSVPTAGQTAATWTVTPVSLTAGTLSIGLNETQTGSLSPAGTYRWYLRWVAPGSVTRTVLSGNVIVAAP